MHWYTGLTALQRYLALAIVLVAGAWLLTVPVVFTTSSFLTLVGVSMVCGWIVRITYLNAQPASSLAQSLHDVEHAGPSEHLSDSR